MQYSVCVQHFWWSPPNSKYVSISPFISVGYYRSTWLPVDSYLSCTKRVISKHVGHSHIRLEILKRWEWKITSNTFYKKKILVLWDPNNYVIPWIIFVLFYKFSLFIALFLRSFVSFKSGSLTADYTLHDYVYDIAKWLESHPFM